MENVTFDVVAAMRASSAGVLEEWVHDYLCGPGRNPKFSRGLRLESRCWRGPLSVPLGSLRRSCGPEADMPFREPPDTWERAVTHLAALSAPLEAFPPLLVRYGQGDLIVSDGNHRHEAFARRGFATCWIVIWYPNQTEFEHHEARHFGVRAA
jgi:hypothetical protein